MLENFMLINFMLIKVLLINFIHSFHHTFHLIFFSHFFLLFLTFASYDLGICQKAEVKIIRNKKNNLGGFSFPSPMKVEKVTMFLLCRKSPIPYMVTLLNDHFRNQDL